MVAGLRDRHYGMINVNNQTPAYKAWHQKGGTVMKRLSKDFVNYEVSNSTLRTQDLIESFSYFIGNVKEQIVEGHEDLSVVTAIIEQSEYGLERGYDGNEEDLDYFLNEELFDFMNDIAPEGCYFGANEGDGAAFGFWQVLEEGDYCEKCGQGEENHDENGNCIDEWPKDRSPLGPGYTEE